MAVQFARTPLPEGWNCPTLDPRSDKKVVCAAARVWSALTHWLERAIRHFMIHCKGIHRSEMVLFVGNVMDPLVSIWTQMPEETKFEFEMALKEVWDFEAHEPLPWSDDLEVSLGFISAMEIC